MELKLHTPLLTVSDRLMIGISIEHLLTWLNPVATWLKNFNTLTKLNRQKANIVIEDEERITRTVPPLFEGLIHM